MESQLGRKASASTRCAKLKAFGRMSVAAERLFKVGGLVDLSHCLGGWRLVWLLRVQSLHYAKRHHFCRGRHLVFILRLRCFLHVQKFFYCWLRILPIKPWETPVVVRPMSAISGRALQFCKEPPQLFIRPVTVTRDASRDPPIGQAERPAMIVDTQASGTAAREAASEAGPLSQVDLPLAPGERFTLANQAMTSDREYRRLLELNRREIREGRSTSCPRGTSAAAAGTGWGDLGTGGNNMMGFGVWVSPNR